MNGAVEFAFLVFMHNKSIASDTANRTDKKANKGEFR